MNYAYHQVHTWVGAKVSSLDTYLKKPEAKLNRLALTALCYFGALLIACTLSWKIVAVAYGVQTLVDFYMAPRVQGQRFDELFLQGLNVGLAVRATLLVLNGLFYLAMGPLLKGVLLASALFFKEDWDQYDWSSYITPFTSTLQGSPSKTSMQESFPILPALKKTFSSTQLGQSLLPAPSVLPER